MAALGCVAWKCASASCARRRGLCARTRGEGFAHVHAVVGSRILQGFVVLQFRFRIAQRGQRMAGACRSRTERNDRCNELVVCRTQPVAAFGVVYQAEELRFRQYEMFHLLSVYVVTLGLKCAHIKLSGKRQSNGWDFLRFVLQVADKQQTYLIKTNWNTQIQPFGSVQILNTCS